jgi:hypothetical protein
MQNGRKIVKDVLHNSYWKYKVQHFNKQQNPMPCLTQTLDVGVSPKKSVQRSMKPSQDFKSNKDMEFNISSNDASS